MIEVLRKLNFILTKRDKNLIKLLILFSLFISLIETVGISIIMPFIAISSDFSLISSNEYYKIIYDFFEFEKEINFVMVFGIVLIFFYFFRSLINLLYVYMQAKFTHSRYYLLVTRLFQHYMFMSYKDYVKKNSSNLTKTIVSEVSGSVTLINSVLSIISEIFVVVLIYSMMLYVNYKITIILTLFLIINAIFLVKIISKKIKNAGIIKIEMHRFFYEIINRSFSNFKFIKLQDNDKKLMNEFSDVSLNFSNANITNVTLQQFPKLFLEAISFGIIIALITFFIWQNQMDIKSILPTISMFVLALYRLMPSINRIISGYNQIMFQQKSLDILYNDLMQNKEILGSEVIDFRNTIKLQDIKFEYNTENLILNKVNFNIEKGEKIAFVGESGSGKSTLVDIIMGLHKPTYGKIFIDNKKLHKNNIKNWRSKIGYIPQNVYLFDGTVADNIVFDREYNEEKVIKVLKQANIYNHILKHNGLETLVGEGGIMLSGGQKQRIAIARALYDNPEILVLDEATSALDNETEAKIMDEIYNVSEDKTLIIIAHRLSTIQRCEKVYKLENGSIV